MTDLREVQERVKAIKTGDLRSNTISLLKSLGYASNKTMELSGSPSAFLEQFNQHPDSTRFSEEKALSKDWKEIQLLFQLTDQELSNQVDLFQDNDIKQSLMTSYLFFAVQLSGKDYARGKLAQITRQLNRLFPMPVMVLFVYDAKLSIAVINRRRNKRDESKDVLGKVTLIQNISLENPHRGHLDILSSFALPELAGKTGIQSFDALHAAWEEIFNVELLNKKFYRELSNWYFWALSQVDFPSDREPDSEKRRATGLIRLLTRLIFCWFIKEKGLIPEKLFDRVDLDDILANFDPDSTDNSSYYQAILQNLFFATLNQRMGKDGRGNPYRRFIPDEGFLKNRSNHDLNNYYRYEKLFCESQDVALSHFSDVPFLNGGLFECLDRRDEEIGKTFYLDGFSRNAKKRPMVPNHLFFSDEIKGVDLSEIYHDKKRKNESVSGLFCILNRYKFTIVENTPIEQEIALDPELLGKVFESLLASYNEETESTARKQTGSFYTPRPIVDYMVDESLKSHLVRALIDKAGMEECDAQAGLDLLFQYREANHELFTVEQVEALIAAIHTCKILDPACGSGAYPMGVLHKLVYILGKLDEHNDRWEAIQVAVAQKIEDRDVRRRRIEEIGRDFRDNDDDYGRKLYLIENCLYGVDIQSIAIQISKLRFFISLVCDQKINRDKAKNHGIRPLPNLETKFVSADSLIGLPIPDKDLFVESLIAPIEKEIEGAYHSHFTIQRRDQKLALQRKIKSLRLKLVDTLESSLGVANSDKAHHLAEWDPFDSQSTADFFDPHWMFGSSLKDGFDIVIGNPPYVQIQKFPKEQKDKWIAQCYTTNVPRGDIYCLFYERGAQLLKEGGHLFYITSNKWMRAGYGNKLRDFLSESVDTTAVLDFGMAQNFGAATTYTNILGFENSKPRKQTRCCYASDDKAAMADPKTYFNQNAIQMPELDSAAWVVVSPERYKIKQAVEALGIPLEKWELNIYRGVLTGLNDAFYLTQEQRDELIATEPHAADLLVPLLRGRYVGRYETKWDKTWMIGTFKQYRDDFCLEEYPAIKKHLSQYRTKLEPRPEPWDSKKEGKWPGRNTLPLDYLWHEVFFAPSLWEFKNPKIIYPNMTKYLPFYYDEQDHFFINDKAFIITSETESLPYLTAVLNSTLFKCCFRDNFPELMGNTYEVRKVFVDKIPIKKPAEPEAELFEKLVSMVQLAKREGLDVQAAFLEELIDACVLELYFPEEAAAKKLLFMDQVSTLLGKARSIATAKSIESFYSTANDPKHPIRNQLIRLTADSPDLFAVIKQEGRV